MGSAKGKVLPAYKKQAKKPADWRPPFLEALALAPFDIGAAAHRAGISRRMAYLERDNNPEFVAAWDAITEQAVDRLEQVAYQYAAGGTKHDSMALLIFMLKARRKAIYGGVGDGPERPPAVVIFKDGRNNA